MRWRRRKTNPVFVAVNVVSVWRPGFPVLRLFVVYIARAPQQLLRWCDSNTWCLESDPFPPPQSITPEQKTGQVSAQRRYLGETHMEATFHAFPPCRCPHFTHTHTHTQPAPGYIPTYYHSSGPSVRAPNSGSGHFQSVHTHRSISPCCVTTVCWQRAAARGSVQRAEPEWEATSTP